MKIGDMVRWPVQKEMILDDVGNIVATGGYPDTADIGIIIGWENHALPVHEPIYAIIYHPEKNGTNAVRSYHKNLIEVVEKK